MGKIWFISTFLSALFLTGFHKPASAEANSHYVKISGGIVKSETAVFAEQSCHPPSGAALIFGCATGNDGRTIGAYGDFGTPFLFELGYGQPISDRVGIEFAIGALFGGQFEGKSNFQGVPDGPAPVTADFSSRYFAVNWHLYFPGFETHNTGGQFYVLAGLGLSQNKIDAMDYRLPTLGTTTQRLTPPGKSHTLYKRLGIGYIWQLSNKFDLDISANVTDFGTVETDEGDLIIINDNSADPILVNIAPTETRLQTKQVNIALRYRF